MRIRMRALAAAAATVGLLLAGAASASAANAPGSQGASSPGPRIVKIGTAEYRPATNTVALPITYRCTDRPEPLGTRHFLEVRMEISSEGWSAGYRNGPGSLVQALCTGQRITHTLILQSDSVMRPYLPYTPPVVRSGYRTTRISLYQTATPDWGGWYMTTGQETSLKGSIWVSAPASGATGDATENRRPARSVGFIEEESGVACSANRARARFWCAPALKR